MRLNFSLGDFYSTLVPLISLTYIIACIDALCREDLKRIIAMSTLGNLSLIFVSLFLGYYILCLFHLCNHALFKSLAFLCGGNIITTKKGSQDIGEGVEIKGVSLICLVVSLLSLIGFPFSSGFFSKDLIFDMLRIAHLSRLGSLASLVLGIIGGAYVYNIFLSVFAVDSIRVEGKVLEDESSLLLVPIIALSFFCIILAPVFRLYLFPFSSEIFVLFCDKILFYSFFGIIVAIDLIEYVFRETFRGSLMFLDDSYDLVTNFGFRVSIVETKSVEYG